MEINQPSTPTGSAGTAQSSATTLGITTDANLPSMGGRFASAYPLYDGTNRMLVSWAPCLVLDSTVTPPTTKICTAANTSGANVQMAPPQYTIWIYDVGKGTLSPILGAEVGMVIVEPVIMQARTPVPAFIPDFVPTGAAADLANNSNGGLGLLVIRSVYDFDGIDMVAAETANAFPNIAALADPKLARAYQRPARFVRIEKAVEIPDKTVRKINNSAFGPAGMGMREILAYAPVEPDGSVKIELPANVPFTIDILDKNARRVGARHTSWMQLIPGETRTCNGCHVAGSKSTPSHGRSGLTASVNSGATAAGAPFPDTVSTLPAANAGDTMADTRAWNTCHTGSTDCSEVPSIDVVYTDVWTDPLVRPADAPLSYLYSNLTTLPPTTIMVPVSLAPPMTAGSANGSVVKFFRMFDGTYQDPVLDHTGFLTTAELRLIAEWLDIGAQYYNDPFVAPAAN